MAANEKTTPLIDRYRKSGLLGNLYYISFTTPLVPREQMMAIHAEHLAFQRDLEERGILFAAGPLLNDDGSAPSGESMNIYRVDSLEAAQAIAESDPMFKHGFRSFKLRPWIMNEGSLSLDLKFSTRTIKVS